MDLVAKRWRRYGKDRVYVSLPDGSEHGRRFGFRDLISGEDTLEAGLTDSERAAFYATLACWDSKQEAIAAPKAEPGLVSPTAPSVEAAPPSLLSPVALSDAALAETSPIAATQSQPAQRADASDSVVVEQPWVDLSRTRAGAAARDQALQKRAQAPVKTTLARVLGVHTDERAWRIGADGEEKVAARLEKMCAKNPAWKVLHAVPVGTRGSDIDHVLIGPAGVFTINTKNHPNAKVFVAGDTLMVNGAKTTYVRNSRYEAERTARLLSAAAGFQVPVQGVVSLVNCIEFTVKKQPRDVHVTTRRRIVDWIGGHGGVLSPDLVDRIFEQARRSTTWTG